MIFLFIIIHIFFVAFCANKKKNIYIYISNIIQSSDKPLIRILSTMESSKIVSKLSVEIKWTRYKIYIVLKIHLFLSLSPLFLFSKFLWDRWLRNKNCTDEVSRRSSFLTCFPSFACHRFVIFNPRDWSRVMLGVPCHAWYKIRGIERRWRTSRKDTRASSGAARREKYYIKRLSIFSFEVYCSLGRNNRAEAHNAPLRELHIKE